MLLFLTVIVFLTAAMDAARVNPKSLAVALLELSEPHGVPREGCFVKANRPCEGAINVAGRDPPILVMGSSGSGKTSYSVKMLPIVLQKNDENEPFVVYMDADTAFDQRSAADSEEAGRLMATKVKD